MANAEGHEPRTLASLPPELLTLVAENLLTNNVVAENLDVQSLANFAAASTWCLTAAHAELHAALLATVRSCLAPWWHVGRRHTRLWWATHRDAMVVCPYFRLPDDLVFIPADAFRNCTCLTTITLPAALTTIEDDAFSGCSSLAEVITFPAALTTIGDFAFRNCSSITELTLPATLTKTGRFSFDGCTALTELTLPAALTTICDGAFGSCTSLTEITLPASLTTIGDGVFDGCSEVTKLRFPVTLTTIGKLAFGTATTQGSNQQACYSILLLTHSGLALRARTLTH